MHSIQLTLHASESNPKFRRSWMFPRAIRKIYPWKLAQICQILNQMALNNWSQDIQNEFSRLLTAGNLKGQNDIRDPKSGGARTYISQLESIGLLYRNKKELFFTLAGKSLIDFETPLKVLQHQLLNYQYPSTYSNGRNVRIDPDIRIKPFVFVLKLLKHASIKYLTVDEITFCVVYGHNSGCEDLIIGKVLDFRKGNSSRSDLLNFIDNPLEDLSTPKATQKDNAKKLLVEAINVANTFKNYLISSSLAYEEAGTKNIIISEEFTDVIDDSILNINNFIPYTPGFDEKFTRAYGSWNKKKDTTTNSERKKLNKGEAIISSQFFEYIGNVLITESAEDFISKMTKDFGFNRDLVLDVITPLIPKSLTFFESKYLELSKGGVATARDFELATAELFRTRLGIDATHTGSIHKKGVGGYSDIILSNESLGECAIADTKASSYYTLPSTDYAKMISNYIPNYKQLGLASDHTLGFILYVAGGLGGEIQSKLLTLYKESGFPASAINAKTLIEVAQIRDLKKDHIWEKLKTNKVLKTSDFH
ncbi:AlwI family type II restriction endonuclease [Pedobacter petrophilus]|uniref:AlwI family type II restriction endonuclease n=1 Tax=Pedobacter petrophilus TaxID=1908241 RepID=A0A7K0G6Y5_9SPHI|nr:AlwI family type II restriction endonuclease [Pedobacter petrophilus]MRX78746.1 AlwI family type II restriction endonuclease [Pedobacter petrophilus]